MMGRINEIENLMRDHLETDFVKCDMKTLQDMKKSCTDGVKDAARLFTAAGGVVGAILQLEIIQIITLADKLMNKIDDEMAERILTGEDN